MSMPVKIRMALRDHWEQESQERFASLRGLLGYDIVIEPNWLQLVKEQEPFYNDKGKAAAASAICINAWSQALTDVLTADVNPDFTTSLKARKGLQAFPETSPDSDQPTTSWSKDRNGFIINLPQAKMPDSSELVSIFQGILPDSLSQEQEVEELPIRSAEGGDAWAEDHSSAAFYQAQQVPVQAPPRVRINKIPDFKTLQKPEQLLALPPYYLILYASRREEVEVECSHTQTLQFLSEYLKKWCKVNPDSDVKAPAVRVKLHQSSFGSGLLYDRLTLTADDPYGNGFLVTPSLIMALIEGALGYERVAVEGSTWTFRKGDPLKR